MSTELILYDTHSPVLLKRAGVKCELRGGKMRGTCARYECEARLECARRNGQLAQQVSL